MTIGRAIAGARVETSKEWGHIASNAGGWDGSRGLNDYRSGDGNENIVMMMSVRNSHGWNNLGRCAVSGLSGDGTRLS